MRIFSFFIMLVICSKPVLSISQSDIITKFSEKEIMTQETLERNIIKFKENDSIFFSGMTLVNIIFFRTSPFTVKKYMVIGNFDYIIALNHGIGKEFVYDSYNEIITYFNLVLNKYNLKAYITEYEKLFFNNILIDDPTVIEEKVKDFPMLPTEIKDEIINQLSTIDLEMSYSNKDENYYELNYYTFHSIVPTIIYKNTVEINSAGIIRKHKIEILTDINTILKYHIIR